MTQLVYLYSVGHLLSNPTSAVEANITPHPGPDCQPWFVKGEVARTFANVNSSLIDEMALTDPDSDRSARLIRRVGFGPCFRIDSA